jgi:hypothetical protein
MKANAPVTQLSCRNPNTKAMKDRAVAATSQQAGLRNDRRPLSDDFIGCQPNGRHPITAASTVASQL